MSDGHFDTITSEGVVCGWSKHPSNNTIAGEVGIIIDSAAVARIRATEFRPDLVAAGFGHGSFGFRWQIPEAYHDGRDHEIILVNMHTNIPLPGSPRKFCLSSDNPISANGLFENAALTVWPNGLIGKSTGPVFSPASSIFVVPEPVGGIFKFQALGNNHSAQEFRYGLQITATENSSFSIYHRFSDGLKLNPSDQIYLSTILCRIYSAEAKDSVNSNVELGIARAKRSHAPEFEKLKTLYKGSVFDYDTELLFNIIGHEFPQDDAFDLYLSIRILDCIGISYFPPRTQSIEVNSIGLHGFEDERLTLAWEHVLNACAQSGTRSDLNLLLYPKHPAPIEIEKSSLANQELDCTIIVPVFNGGVEVLRCLESIASHSSCSTAVLVIDDGSNPYTSKMISDFSRNRNRFSFIRRDQNLGYTSSVNEGLLLTKTEFAVILNSDTVVTAGWLEKLLNCMKRFPATGMVGPLSNAASWQSVPAVKDARGDWSKNEVITLANLEKVSKLVEDLASPAVNPTVPLLNGFCTLVRMAAIREAGALDPASFPIGYGEETDLCLRLSQAGFELRLADDCFIYHHKSISFGNTRRKLLSRAGMRKLRAKHSGVNFNMVESQFAQNERLNWLRNQLMARLGEVQ